MSVCKGASAHSDVLISSWLSTVGLKSLPWMLLPLCPFIDSPSHIVPMLCSFKIASNKYATQPQELKSTLIVLTLSLDLDLANLFEVQIY